MMRYGPGMMGYGPVGAGEPVGSIAEARGQAERFAGRLGLHVGEVMRFRNNYYAELVGKRGAGATEVLVNPRIGAVWLEYGPAMMWNTQYGMLGGRGFGGLDGGMMGGGGMMSGGGMMGGGMMSGAPFGGIPPTGR